MSSGTMHFKVIWYDEEKGKEFVEERDIVVEDVVARVTTGWTCRFQNPSGDYFSWSENIVPLSVYADLMDVDFRSLQIRNSSRIPSFYIYQQRCVENWLLITYQGCEKEDGVIFAFREAEDKPFRYIPVPENCRVDIATRSFNITYHYEGRDLIFERGEAWWPDVLLDPKKLILLGLVRRMLMSDSTNPLTMLLRSKDKLVFGLARQIAEELKLVLANFPEK